MVCPLFGVMYIMYSWLRPRLITSHARESQIIDWPYYTLVIVATVDFKEKIIPYPETSS